MDETSFDQILAVCDSSVDGYAPPDDARAHCDAVLALTPDDFESLLMARDFKMAGTNAASRQNQSNQLDISNGTFAQGPSASSFGRGMPGRGCGRGRGAPCQEASLQSMRGCTWWSASSQELVGTGRSTARPGNPALAGCSGGCSCGAHRHRQRRSSESRRHRRQRLSLAGDVQCTS